MNTTVIIIKKNIEETSDLDWKLVKDTNFNQMGQLLLYLMKLIDLAIKIFDDFFHPQFSNSPATFKLIFF